MSLMWKDVLVVGACWCLSLVNFARGGYNIILTTGSRDYAGTDSVMNYRLQGTNGDSGTRVFPGQVYESFEKNSVDHFYEPEDFGILEAVTIGHDNSKDYADWDFHKVTIHDRLRGYDYEFVCDCWIPEEGSTVYYRSFSNTGRTMNNGETLVRWNANLCNLDGQPQIYQDTGDHVTGLLSDGFPQTCEPLFPSGMYIATSVMFIHRIVPSRSLRLNVIGRYIDCSPITGLWMFVMGDSGGPEPCTSYIGVNVGNFTMCRYRCITDGFVNYTVLGISDRHAIPTLDTAVICDITLV